MEEIGENSNGNSQIQNITWNSEFSQNLQIFKSKYLEICWELDKTSNLEVVDLALIYKFTSGQNLSSVQNSSEKSSWKSAKQKS